MAMDTWTESDTQRAQQYWAEYQQQHDVSEKRGQTAGIDPVSGCVWFGASAREIVAKRAAEGLATPLYFIRVGSDYYLRKGGQR